MSLTGAAVVAGVVGSPVTHSLSPLIHNAWIAAAGLDAVYAPFSPPPEHAEAFIQGLRGGAMRGLNVTVPYKEIALALANRISASASRAGAANILVFERDGEIFADNSDGLGMLAALTEQAPDFDVAEGPAVILGAGGAARGAAAALADAGTPEIRLVNRTPAHAEVLAAAVGGPCRIADPDRAFEGVRLIVNATTLGLGGGEGPPAVLKPGIVVLDMVYRPLRTEFLARAAAAGCVTVDGLAMLIGQAAPSFEAFFGRPPPPMDVRALCLAALGEA
ncbi:MAG TPA: shikimate dehydrogenase [Caulobacteraceae bacterium]|jgi:shikimate dehydrogenase|nr:shikimate dehydrogenase [Caulobacteraceae bacterium]